MKWATCNVGASSPGDYGKYYAWGETSAKDDYSWSTYKWHDNSTSTITKYNADDKKKKLDPSDDAATANWGGDWRMPTKEDFEELREHCTWEWITLNGNNGCKVTGPNGNSIFLPAAGWRYGADEDDVGSSGFYWSSTPDKSDSDGAYLLYFNEGHYVDRSFRFQGFSVRPVLE